MIVLSTGGLMAGGTLRRSLRRLPGWDAAMRRRRALGRSLADARAGVVPAAVLQAEDLPVLVFTDRSPLQRADPDGGRPERDRLAGPLQAGKHRNLARAAQRLDGILLRPGETLSFWRLVGAPTARRGFAAGPVLREEELDAGSGGGLCAASNLLHWLALHTDLELVEHSEHTVDPFPDRERTIPWGAGCTVTWPRLDLRVANRGTLTYQWRLSIAAGFLVGRVLADRVPAHAYVVYEREAAFAAAADGFRRSNQLWRRVHDAGDGRMLGEQLLVRNDAPTAYRPARLGAVPALPPRPLRLPTRS